MPFKSLKQMAKFYKLVEEGKMSKETLEKWKSETTNIKDLPNKVGKELRRDGIIKAKKAK